MQYDLTEEQIMLRDTVRRIAQEQIAPGAAARDAKGEFAQALGLTKDFPWSGEPRFARFAMILRDGVVEKLFVQDVAGVTVSGAPAILLALQGEAVS